MPEVTEDRAYSFTAAEWRRFAAFHARAAGVMETIAEALEAGNRARFHEAMGEFAEMAAEQDRAPVGAATWGAS